jgi:hypothetical protein
LIRLALLSVVLLGTAACALGQSSSKPALGDACMVGGWTLQHEENRSGYAYASEPVAVAGLQGARLVLDAGGTETIQFDASQPLVGTLSNGRVLSITIRGSAAFKIHADGHNYTETGSQTVLPTTATLDGAPISDYHSSYAAGRGTYSCSPSSLTVTTASNVQTDTWTRESNA